MHATLRGDYSRVNIARAWTKKALAAGALIKPAQAVRRESPMRRDKMTGWISGGGRKAPRLSPR